MRDKGKHLTAIIKYALVYSLGAGITQVAGFLLLPVYTRLLTVEQYGTWAIVQSVQSLASIFLALGLANSLSRIYYDNQSDDVKNQNTASIFWVLLVWGGAVTGIALLFRNGISEAIFKTAEVPALTVMLIVTFLPMMLYRNLLTYLQIKIRPKAYSIIRSVQVILFHLFAILFVMKGFSVSGIVGGSLVSAVVAVGILVVLLKKEIRPSDFNPGVLRPLFISGMPLMLISLTSWVMNLSDRYFINHFIDAKEVGLYSLAYNIVGVLAFVNMISTQSVPIYLFKVREENRQLGEHLQTEMLRYYTVITSLVTLLLSLFAFEVITLLAPDEYIGAKKFVPLLAFSYVFLGGFDIMHVGIANAKKFNYLLVCFGSSCLLNTLLNFLLIPKYAGMGAAAATAISYFLLMILGNVYSQKTYFMKWHYTTPIVSIVVMTGLLCSTLLTKNMNYAVQLGWKIILVATYCFFIWFYVIQQIERKTLLRNLCRVVVK